MQNLLKLILLLVVGGLSLNIGRDKINHMVIEVHKREKTIADALIKQQVQEMFKEAEKEIAKVEASEKVKIKVEEVKIKPPLPEKEKVSKKEVEKKEEKAKEEGGGKEGIETVKEAPFTEKENEKTVKPHETKVWVGAESQIDVATYSTLTEEEILIIGNYLIEHYFLFGYDYYIKEEDPIRYERKKLASDMEDQIIGSLQNVFGLSKNLNKLNKAQLQEMKEEAKTYANTFKEQFIHVGEKGEDFRAIYESGNGFFNTYIETLEKGENVFTLLEQTTNKALILPILMNQMNETILPSAKAVLNEGFTLKEKTNTIYIEGIDESFLITPKDVMAILENPYSILPPKEEEIANQMEEAVGEATDNKVTDNKTTSNEMTAHSKDQLP